MYMALTEEQAWEIRKLGITVWTLTRHTWLARSNC